MCQIKELDEDICIKNCVNAKIQGLEEYTKKCKERLIAATSNRNVNKRTHNKTRKFRNGKKNNCMDISSDKMESCTTYELEMDKKGKLKTEIESPFKSGQNNIIRTKHLKAKRIRRDRMACVMSEEVGKKRLFRKTSTKRVED